MHLSANLRNQRLRFRPQIFKPLVVECSTRHATCVKLILFLSKMGLPILPS